VIEVKRVLIVGGGIAGLATAAGLTRAGVECVIAENAEAWRPVGAGIVLNVNAMTALRMLGLADAVESRGFRLSAAAITDQTGRDLARTDFAILDAEFGATIALHRAELHSALLEGAADAEIILDTSVERIVQHPDGVDARLTNGREDHFDLVIGADGLHSRVRELTFGHIPTVYAGYTCWRFVADAQPEQSQQSRMCEMWGRGKRFGVVPIGKTQFYVFAVANAAPGTPDPKSGSLERFRDRFSDFGGPAPALLEALEDPDKLIHNDLRAIPAGNWFNDHVVLVGDAAHAMTPNMGQGAGMGLEDAAVLVELLQQGGTVSDTFKKYRARRESRVGWVQNQSRRIGQIAQLENAIACRLRYAVVKMIPNSASDRALRKLVSQPI
jgi:2-polyprenyl-6-methoxyphenol hydroxylase-like FAD-dependent oxidoreductase